MEQDDKYGSVFREGLKRSMEQPYRSYNRREPQRVRASVLILFMVSVLAAGVLGFYALDKYESRYRTPVVQR